MALEGEAKAFGCVIMRKGEFIPMEAFFSSEKKL